MRSFSPYKDDRDTAFRGGDDPESETSSAGNPYAPTTEKLVELARKVSRMRSVRPSYFASELFSEPAWEMLLALLVADSAGYRMTITNVCDSCNAPDSTALRWLDKMKDSSLVRRRKNPTDARIVYIEIEPHAKTALIACLRDMWKILYGTA